MKQCFGPSSEKSASNDGMVQLSYCSMSRNAWPGRTLLNQTWERWLSKRMPPRRAVQEQLPEDIEVEVIEKTLTAEESVCPQRQSQMNDIGKDVSRRLKIIPARFVVEETHEHKCACKHIVRSRISPPR